MRKALQALPWVRQVEVDFNRQQAVAMVVSENYDEKALLKAIDKVGFKAKVVKNEKIKAK